MVTDAAYRKLALSLPEAEEKGHMGHPDFRVRNKIFATLQPTRRIGVVKLEKDFQVALLDAEPAKFEASWGTTGWTGVRLDRVGAGELRALLVHSWRLVAPRRLVADFDAERKRGDGDAV